MVLLSNSWILFTTNMHANFAACHTSNHCTFRYTYRYIQSMLHVKCQSTFSHELNSRSIRSLGLKKLLIYLVWSETVCLRAYVLCIKKYRMPIWWSPDTYLNYKTYQHVLLYQGKWPEAKILITVIRLKTWEVNVIKLTTYDIKH